MTEIRKWILSTAIVIGVLSVCAVGIHLGILQIMAVITVLIGVIIFLIIEVKKLL